MSTLIIGLFLLLFGLEGLVSMNIPHWVIPLLALVAGILLLVGEFRGMKKSGPT